MLPQAKAYRVNQNEKYIQSWIEVYSDWLNTFPCPEGTVSKDAVQWYGLQPAERVLDQIDIIPHLSNLPTLPLNGFQHSLLLLLMK